jgi:hypothetical protein
VIAGLCLRTRQARVPSRRLICLLPPLSW